MKGVNMAKDKKATQAPPRRGSGHKIKVGGTRVRTGTAKGKLPTT